MKCMDCGETEDFMEEVWGRFQGVRNPSTDSDIDMYEYSIEDSLPIECLTCGSTNVDSEEK